MIKLSKPVGDRVGWMGLRIPSESGVNATITGYPSDKPAGTMWSAQGTIDQITPAGMRYKIDTFGGQSGSPIYNGAQVIGIHTAGSFSINHGIALSDALLNTIVNLSHQ